MTSTVEFRGGDLAVASGSVLRKYHLLRLTRNRLEECEREWAGRLEGTEGMSARRLALALKCYTDPATLDEEQRRTWPTMWSGDTLCGAENQKASYGNVSRYYWTAYATQPDDEARCKKCWQRWRAAGRPVIRGWTDEVESDEVPLPFGWSEVPVAGHPWDVGKDGDPTAVRNSADEVVGVRRTELRRWQRGDRYVRVVELHDDAGAAAMHGVLYGRADRPLAERWNYSAAPTRAVEHAHKLMAIGGFP